MEDRYGVCSAGQNMGRENAVENGVGGESQVFITMTHFPTHFYALQDFTLTTSREPHTYQGRVVNLRWNYYDIEKGDMLKYSPAGVLTVFRAGRIVEQQQVSALAIRSFARCAWIHPA
jgi:hypothetical protein